MAGEYIVPLGIDGDKVTAGLNTIIKGIDGVENKAGEAGRSIEEAFSRGAKASDGLEASLKPTAKNLESIAIAGRQVGKDLVEALSTKNTKGIDDGIAKIRSKLESIGKNVNFNIDDAKLRIFEHSVGEAKTEIDQLNAVLEFTKSIMQGLDTNSPEYIALAEAVTFAGSAFDEFDNSVNTTVTANKSLKSELRATKEALAELEISGQGGSKQFRDLSVRAAQLEDQIGDTNLQIKTLASDSKYLDATVSGVTGLVGAFTLAQGAASLFGDENEDLQKALLKVNGAMAVLQGLQAVAETLNKDSAFSVIFLRNSRLQDVAATEAQTVATAGQTVVTEGATLATKALGFAFKAIGIGLIIGLIALLVENWDDLKASLNKLLPAGESVGKLFDKIKSYAVGVGNAVLQYLITPFKALTALLSGDFAGFKKAVVDGFSFKKNFTDGFNQSELSNEKKHKKELEEERIKADERDLARRKARGENVDKQEIALQKRRIAIADADSKERKTETEKLQDLQDKNFKTTKDANEKAAADAKKLREDASKKRLEDEKKNSEQLVKFTRAAEDIRIASITDGLARERAKITEEYRRKNEDLKKEAATTKEAQQKLKELSVLLVQERDAKIKQAEESAAKERLSKQLDYQQGLADLQEEGTDRSLKLLQIDHEKRKATIEDQYRDDAEQREKLLSALEKSTAREKEKIVNEASAKAMDNEEKTQLLMIELSSQYAKKSEKTERQKQIAIYETKIEFAEKALDLLVASGADENSLEVLTAKKNIADLRDGLQKEVKAGDGKGFNFLDFIGLGGLSDGDQGLVKKYAAETAKNIGQITDFIVDQYQRQIDKRQEVIDQIDGQIKDLESSLDKEKSLRDKGFANNVDLIEAEIAVKQKQKDEEIKQQQDLMKKKQDLQKAQFAADTAIQLVNLITASTEIFKSLAGIPFVGIPLAIATIGTMFGAFALSKVKAAQSITDIKYGEGGEIDGKSHAAGGTKYYSESGSVRELEAGEFVVRKKQAKKFSNLLDAINNGRFTGFDINDLALKEMLGGMGIDLSERSSEDGLKEAKKLSNTKISVEVKHQSNERELKEMNDNIRFLADREREKVSTWEDDKYFYSKIGSRTIRIPKSQKPKEDATEK